MPNRVARIDHKLKLKYFLKTAPHIDTPRASKKKRNGEGYPLPQLTGHWTASLLPQRSRMEPQQGLEQSLSLKRRRCWCILCLKNIIWWIEFYSMLLNLKWHYQTSWWPAEQRLVLSGECSCVILSANSLQTTLLGVNFLAKIRYSKFIFLRDITGSLIGYSLTCISCRV